MSHVPESTTRRRPTVLMPACNRMIGPHPYQVAGKKYVDAIRLAGATPLIIPSSPEDSIDELLDIADGVLFSGSPSNVHPRHFDEAVHDPDLPLDPDRDAVALPLIRAAIQRGLPMLAICRGLQETNVALGGSLQQAVHAQPGMMDHRESDQAPVDVQYGPAHRLDIHPGGVLEKLLGSSAPITVNSLHGQGIGRLAPGMRVEATAPDGLIEAFSVQNAPGFTLAMQWHPEWRAADNPVSRRIFAAFGAACQDYRDRHRPPRA